MIGRHQMRGWRKLKSGLMRITGSAHIYYPIREIDSCRRRTRHSNFGWRRGSWSLLVICPPSSSMIECSKLGSCRRSRIAFKIIILVLIVFFCFLIGIGSVIKNDWYGSPILHSFIWKFCILDQGLLLDEDADFAGGAKVELLFVVVIFQLET